MKTLRAGVVCVSLLTLLSSSFAHASSSDALTTPAEVISGMPPSDAVIGRVGDKTITTQEVLQQNAALFARQTDAYLEQLRKLQLSYSEARHALLQKQLETMLDQHALEQEARTRGVSIDQVQAGAAPGVVSDQDARTFYAANHDRISQPYEQVSDQIKAYLRKQRDTAASRELIDRLRRQHGIANLLPAFRVRIDATGPVRGNPSASVTIVEFGDFQCPYCKLEEATLRTLLERYPTQVRLVFRNLPLTSLHPHAMEAASAGVCAARQHKFWSMHDAMYADQSQLDASGLAMTAKRLGLDTQAFNACLKDPTVQQAIDADMQAAHRLAIDGTPFFFVDGRPIDGSVPIEQFVTVIDEELRRGTPLSATVSSPSGAPPPG